MLTIVNGEDVKAYDLGKINSVNDDPRRVGSMITSSAFPFICFRIQAP